MGDYDTDHAVIERAFLNLYVTKNSAANLKVDVKENISAWTEDGLTNAAIPVTGKTIASKVDFSGTGWKSVDISSIYKTSYPVYGVRLAPNPRINGGVSGTNASNATTFIATSENTDVSLRPYLTITYLQKPTIGFHDGLTPPGYFSDNTGENFKYLEFGTLVAGQTSIAQKVYIRNLSLFDIYNTQIYVDPSQWPSNVFVELSETNSPFVAQERIYINGTISPNQDVPFYCRLSTTENANTSTNFNIYVKAVPVF
ncbi:hypothetical protein D3C75_517290 [compost metagenome]